MNFLTLLKKRTRRRVGLAAGHQRESGRVEVIINAILSQAGELAWPRGCKESARSAESKGR